MTFVSRPKPCFLDGVPRVARSGPPRWRSADGERLYEWDGLHGEIEMYNRRGRHLGALDAVSGELIKPPKRGRVISV